MADHSDFKQGQIVDARIVSASLTKSVRLLSVSRETVSKVMTAFERDLKMSSEKHKSGQKLE